MNKPEEEKIYGYNPVINALESKRLPKKVYISRNRQDKKVIDLCEKKNIPYELTDVKVLDRMSQGHLNQGFVAIVPSFEYASLDQLLKSVEDKKNSLVVMLDGIEDPNNFGSLIRTCACFGVDGIIIGKDRQVQMTPTVAKVATGAEEYVNIIKVTNLASTIEVLKKHNYWIACADGSGKSYYDEIDYKGKMVVVIGSEGKGASRLTMEKSDFIIRIPIDGPITSLNASVAGAIIIAHAKRQQEK